MLNRVMLIANLGADPDVRYTQAGNAVTSFNVATEEKWKDVNGNLQNETTWHKIVIFGKLAEVCGEHLKKGMRVYLEGKIKNRDYVDKEGVKKYTTEIVCHTMKMLSPKKHGDHDNTSSQPELPEPPMNNGTGEEVPF